MLSLTMRHELSHRLELEHKLLHELQLQYTLRLELVAALREDRYQEDTECPSCLRRLSLAEILKGFRDDPHDYTTECPSCGTRFMASIACKDRHGKIVLGFYCPLQTIDQLYSMIRKAPEEIRKEKPSVYHSAVIHFGSLKAAFAQFGVDYSLEGDFEGWEAKVIPFLGRLPDAEIARCVGVPARKVRALRVKEGIERFRKEKREEW